jgi:hypothetical protein
VRHEKRVRVEGFSPIILQKLQIANQVNHQKEHQKQSGQSHDPLLTNGRT